MQKINFIKMVASGNDFVVIGSVGSRLQAADLAKLTRNICDRKFGVGADGLLVLGKSKKADVRMRIFNADGSEAQMCGNGARCVALFKSKVKSPLPASRQRKSKVKIETRVGVIESEIKGDNVKIKLTQPQDLKLNIPLKLKSRILHVNFINTGVPHAVIFVEGLDKIDVDNLGREIRYHQTFSPKGTNVDFVEVLAKDTIAVRTYERGVEAETLACGTGSVASSLITDYRLPITDYHMMKVYTKGGEILRVYFKRNGGNFSDVWLEGQVRIVFKGDFLY